MDSTPEQQQLAVVRLKDLKSFSAHHDELHLSLLAHQREPHRALFKPSYVEHVIIGKQFIGVLALIRWVGVNRNCKLGFWFKMVPRGPLLIFPSR